MAPARIEASTGKGGFVLGNKEITTDAGKIILSEEVIATIAGAAATECYGIVGMSAGRLRDGIATILGRENLSRGVEVSLGGDGSISVTLHIIVGYGTRISEVAHNVIEKVSYALHEATGLRVGKVNIEVDGVQVRD